MDQSLQGKIGKFTLPEIFQLIANGGKTGTLGIQNNKDIVMVYFKDGRITYGYGPRQTSHIGQILSEKGKISAGQLEDAVAYQSKSEVTKRLGKILIDKGYVAQEDLNQAIKRQVEELIYSLLSWENGSFKFYENQYPTNEEITVNISIENVILEGLRRIDEVNHLKETLPEFDKPLRISETTADRAREIFLEPEEWNLLANIDGRKTIDNLLKESHQPEFKTLGRLASLKLAGLISESDKPVESSDHLTDMVNRVSNLLEQYLANRTEKSSSSRILSETISEENS